MVKTETLPFIHSEKLDTYNPTTPQGSTPWGFLLPPAPGQPTNGSAPYKEQIKT
jgi:hypothetical protein